MTILELLEEHEYIPSHLDQAYPVCLCLKWRASSPLANRTEHRAHLAEVLEEWVQEQRAEAWDSCDDAWEHAHSLDNLEPFEHVPLNPYR